MAESTQPVVLQLRYPDVDTFVQRFAPNVTRGGVFIATRTPEPVGSIIRFQIALLSGPPLLSGSGKVIWVRDFDPAAPSRAHGMGVQFMALDPETQPLLDRLLKARSGPPAAAATGSDRSGPQAIRTTRPNVPAFDAAAHADFDRGIEESAIRRARDFARVLGGKEDDLDALSRPEAEEKVSLGEALAGLPQFLQPRRKTGLLRTISEDTGRDGGHKPGDQNNE